MEVCGALSISRFIWGIWGITLEGERPLSYFVGPRPYNMWYKITRYKLTLNWTDQITFGFSVPENHNLSQPLCTVCRGAVIQFTFWHGLLFGCCHTPDDARGSVFANERVMNFTQDSDGAVSLREVTAISVHYFFRVRASCCTFPLIPTSSNEEQTLFPFVLVNVSLAFISPN